MTQFNDYTGIKHLLNLTNTAAATVRTEIPATGFPNLALHLKGTGGVTFTVWATNNASATTTADTGWVDITSTVIGAASLVDDEGIYFISNKMPLKYMIKYVTSDTSNTVDVWVRSY